MNNEQGAMSNEQLTMSNEQKERHAERSRGISPATTTPFVR
jgi:hypothetical protein